MKDAMEHEKENSVQSNKQDITTNCNKIREIDNLQLPQNNNQNNKSTTEQKTQGQNSVIHSKMLLQACIQERIRQELQKKKLQMNQQQNQILQKQSSLVEEIQQNEEEVKNGSLQTIQNLIGQIIKKKNGPSKQVIQEEGVSHNINSQQFKLPTINSQQFKLPTINSQQFKLPIQCQQSPEVDKMMEQIINDIPENQLLNIFATMENQTCNTDVDASSAKKRNQNIVEIEDEQDLQSKNQNGITIPLEEAHCNLKVASAIKSFLPNYRLENVIWCLQKQINTIEVDEKANRMRQLNQQYNRYPSYNGEPLNLAKKMYPTQKNNLPIPRNSYGPPVPPPPRMKLRHYQPYCPPSPFSEANNIFPVPQKHQNRKNIQAYRQSVTKNIASPKNMTPQKPAPVENSKNSERQSLERQIAHVFVTKGYGLTLTKQYTKQQIQGNRYNSLLTSVIRSGLRKLCEIMNKNLKQNVRCYDSSEERLLRSSLVNCRKWLSRTQQQTFYKIINIAYGMSQEPIYQEEVSSLYERIKKELGRRITQQKGKKIKPDGSVNGGNAKKASNTSISQNISSKTITSQSSSNNFFSPPQMIQRQNSINQRTLKGNQSQVQTKNQFSQNSSSVQSSLSMPKNNVTEPLIHPVRPNLIQYEREIVGQYSNYKNVDQVFLYLSKKYKDIQWNKDDLIQTIQKLIKIGLKKILKFRKEFIPQSPNLPPLNLNESIVSSIIHAPVALETRVIVVKSLLQNNLTLLRTVQLISAVNNCIQQLISSPKKMEF